MLRTIKVLTVLVFALALAPGVWAAMVKPAEGAAIRRVATVEQRKFADVLLAIEQLSQAEQNEVRALIQAVHEQGGSRDQARDAVSDLIRRLGAGDLDATQSDGRFDLSSPALDTPGSTARLSFEVGKALPVQISVYNVLGQKVKQLVDAKLQPGVYEAAWDGVDEAGRSVRSGVYFVKMTADGFDRIKKVKIIRA